MYGWLSVRAEQVLAMQTAKCVLRETETPFLETAGSALSRTITGFPVSAAIVFRRLIEMFITRL